LQEILGGRNDDTRKRKECPLDKDELGKDFNCLERIVTWRLKGGIVDPENISVGRQRSVNTFSRQPPVNNRAIARLNTSLNNRGTLGNGVFYSVRAKVA
jgi:hypothetical protein